MLKGDTNEKNYTVRPKIIINAVTTKQRSGGGFQIASNFIARTLTDESAEWFYTVSQDFDDACGKMMSETDDGHYFVVPTQPDAKSYLDTRRRLKQIENDVKPDLIYSIVAPSYFSFSQKEIMEHDNAWDTNMTRLAFSTLNLRQKCFFLAKGWLVRRLLRRAYGFFTQSETVKNGIVKATGNERVKVIPNVLPLTFQTIDAERERIWHDTLSIVFVAAPSKHKNLSIIPEVALRLRNEYGLSNFRFIVTIPKENPYSKEFQLSAERLSVEEHIENVGFQTQEQLKALYLRCDIGFFPSVLETFSATLLEYMKFRLPIVATDLPFNREVTLDAALYFEPRNAKQAAEAIARIANDEDLRAQLIDKGLARLRQYDDYEKNYQEKVDFLKQIISENNTNE